MTAFNFCLKKDILVISMDTLASDSITKQPLKFVDKIHPLFNSNCVVCGTGSLDGIEKWLNYIKRFNIIEDIEQLTPISNEWIPRIMHRYTKTTIYQFGYSTKTNGIIGYAYRSDNNYKCEKLKYNISIKPQEGICKKGQSISEDDLKQFLSKDDKEFFFKIMQKQKQYDDNINAKEKVGIGGICQIFYLNKNGFILENYKKFDDYEKTKNEIIENITILK